MSNRIIKFRAFHMEKKIMATVSSLYWNGNVHVSYKVGPEKPGYFFGGNNNGADWHKGEYSLMQFTNLLDKNGKEIYCGDILISGGRVIGHIEDGVRGYCYDVVYVKPTGDKRWSLYACVTTDYEGNVEVIGNIYENPKLLNP